MCDGGGGGLCVAGAASGTYRMCAVRSVWCVERVRCEQCAAQAASLVCGVHSASCAVGTHRGSAEWDVSVQSSV